MHVNTHTVTRGLAISSHVGKCVKDVRTGLQNANSRFVDETIYLSLSLSLSLSTSSSSRHLSSFSLSLSSLATGSVRILCEIIILASRKGEGARRDASRRNGRRPRFRSRDLAKRERKGIPKVLIEGRRKYNATHPVGSDIRSFVRPYASTPREDPRECNIDNFTNSFSRGRKFHVSAICPCRGVGVALNEFDSFFTGVTKIWLTRWRYFFSSLLPTFTVVSLYLCTYIRVRMYAHGYIDVYMRVTQHNELDFTFSFENGIAEWGGPWHTSHTEARCSLNKREREEKERQRERVDQREREREIIRLIFFATNITSYRYHTCIANIIRDSNRTLEDDVYVLTYADTFLSSVFFSSTG
ncbi:uncharacterized protein LOC122534532 [Frieseomelitta varia]|uniref:uncharacterized protein LOC122534532 n=1 Tax=Frieseomelitta varia TaxID=561572 RepID=UPI001CB69AE5|nr:uncharacterized protein LOC122534532 [Frieseomelitta varia]